MESDKIIKIVCDYYKVPVEEIYLKCRKEKYVVIRSVIYYILKNSKNYKLTHIAKLFKYSNRTVINGLEFTNYLITSSKDYQKEIKKIYSILNFELPFCLKEKLEFNYKKIIENLLENDLILFMKLNLKEKDRETIYEDLNLSREKIYNIEKNYVWKENL